jgi:two-component system, sensor histidine kinase
MPNNDEAAVYKRMLERERNARKAAERILEKKSLELYQANEKLSEQNRVLETLVKERTYELELSERQLKFALEESGDGMWQMDFVKNEIYFSPRYKSSLGYRPDEFPNEVEFWFNIVHPDDQHNIRAVYAEYLKGIRSEHNISYRVRSKRAGWKWLLDNGKTVKVNNEKKPLLIIGVNTDITLQKQAESEIRFAADRLSHMISHLQSGVLLENELRKIEVVNQTFCEIFSINAAPAQLLGTDCSQSAQQMKAMFIDPEGFVKRIDEVLDQKITVSNDELEMSDGRILSRAYIPFFVDNEYKGHLWKYTDITDPKRYEQKLKQQEEKYRGIIENMNLGLIEVDLNEKIIYANQSFCNISGYSADELTGRNTIDLFLSPEARQNFESRQHLRNNGQSDAYEIQVRNKRGEVRWWMISGAPMYDPKGEITGSIGIHVDITNQIEVEEQLRNARQTAENSARVKEAFMVNMSHEIRTPMNAISGFGKQLLNTELNDKQRSFVNAINAASTNLLVVINDILDISKIEAGKMSVERISFSLREVVDTACNILIEKAEEKNLKLQKQIDKNLAEVLIGDPFRISQVLINLIGNSIKFTEKGEICICINVNETGRLGQEIELTIRDTGVGMSKDFLQHIFDKFRQEDDSTARTHGGTGLGMSITRELIELMGGTISVKSEKDAGTEFKIALIFPIGNAAELTAQYPEIVPDNQLAGKTIIVAEDNPYNQLLASTILERYGATVVVCEQGEEVLSALEKQYADVVLMDVQMPVMDGLECTRKLRKLYGTGLPVVALTANAILGEREKCLAAGMDDFLSKPFEEQVLIRKVFKWIAAGSFIIRNKEKQKDQLPDLSRLKKIAAGDEAFLKKMLAIFVNDVPKQLAEMQLAYTANDFVKLAKLAHRIKPSVRDIGLNVDYLQEIENAGKENVAAENVKDKLPQCIAEIEQAIQQIRENYL